MEFTSEKLTSVLNNNIVKAGDFFKVMMNTEESPLIFEDFTEKALKGKADFIQTIEEIQQSDATKIRIKLYKKVNVQIQKNPYKTVDVPMGRQSRDTATEDILGQLGGTQSILSAHIKAVTLQQQLGSIEVENTKNQVQVENLIAKNEKLKEELSKLTFENRELMTDLKEKDRFHQFELMKLNDSKERLKEESSRALELFESKHNTSQALLSTVGTIAANVMGMDAEKLSGYLGITPDGPAESKENKVQKSTGIEISNDIDFEESDLTGTKADAKRIADSIGKWMNELIQGNSEETALSLLQSVYAVNSYMATSTENINLLVQLIKEN